MTTEQIAATLLEIADFLKSQNDPYAELKAAHKAGKVIQIEVLDSKGEATWEDLENPCFSSQVGAYRIKPESTFTLPPCAPGMEWHRLDGWKPGDLPHGWRPLVKGESIQQDDQWRRHANQQWETVLGDDSDIGHEPETSHPFRTRRTLTFTHAGKQWTWHRPGDPRPCDGDSEVQVILVGGKSGLGYTKEGDVWLWDDRGSDSIIGWRYADEKKAARLGPNDVMPFTVIRRKGETETWHWRTVSYVDAVKVTCGNRGYEWDELASDYERNESIPITGKWDPDAWQPCHKPA